MTLRVISAQNVIKKLQALETLFLLTCRSSSGMIFYLSNQQGALLTAFLHNGHVNVSINMISTSYATVSLLTSKAAHDGLWHDLTVKRTGSLVEVNLDGVAYQTRFTITGKICLFFC